MHITEGLRQDLWDTLHGDSAEGGTPLRRVDLLRTPEGRRALTEFDPLLFAYVYFPHHLQDAQGSMTLCDFHLDLLDYAAVFAEPKGVKSKEHRACFIAPRSSGKSTWIFLLLPMWAAAHGHRKFVAAFSDSETQALTHLYSFKQELETNELLRNDYPDLCAPKQGSTSARTMMDNRSQTQRANGFIFMAKGADSASLGMKVGALRPDVLLFDDIEPGESNYSEYEARKRKETLISDLFALNTWAVVAIVGTTTMPNSLIDQMRKVYLAHNEYEGEPELFRESLDPDYRWVVDEHIDVHYWPVIMADDDGNEQSLWPERWPLEDLNNDRHTRAFAKNMMNRPLSSEGGYWDEADIDIDRPSHYRRTILCVDPAVTTAKKSDYTGLAVLSMGSDGLIYVRHAEQTKLDSEQLANRVTDLIDEFGVGICVVETNQGGDLWRQVFKNIPCKYQGIRAKDKKEVRAAKACDYYKRGKVKHTAHFATAEEQMLAFPHVTHDDVVDAIVTGVLAFTKGRAMVSATQSRYMEV